MSVQALVQVARQATGALVREPDIPSWCSSGTEVPRASTTTLRRCGDSPIALLITR